MLQRFRRRPLRAEPPAVAARWEEIRGSEPDLAAGIELQRTVQRIQRKAVLDAVPPSFTADEARQLLAAGRPLLTGCAPFFDLVAAADLFCQFCRTVMRGEAQAEARALLDAIERGSLDLRVVLRAACALDEPTLEEHLVALGERAALTRMLLHYTVAPAFHVAALSYAALLEDSPWTRSICPVCGLLPLLGELRGGESRRVLRCGRCGASWQFQRLRCVYCDSRDFRRLSSLHLEGQGDFLRIEVCTGCLGYIKSMARLDPIPYELLPAEDLATAHLDLLAIERGYTTMPMLGLRGG